ncbi:hypothetical protein H072_5169 [Dactylellina haptotyla CBS 200.50]|uniref:FAD-binding PCMH-type domain-containing protein n=1 Tax=Dactylellina haptotyla (strain CBS 200.50) TaxID=1284197 RepID=S8C049_DACHA|nr:hypothetical protein H072_5169 [Dactylellina haptotyla CBS 200.50]
MGNVISWIQKTVLSIFRPSHPLNTIAIISGILGDQLPPASTDYANAKYQYATSSYGEEHHMNPALIVIPKNKDDIVKTLQYARSQKVAVAIRTGGHQYSGASSTAAPNIQIDLKKTFQGPDDRRIFQRGGETFVHTSVSFGLGEFNDYLGQNGLFVPHGQCTNVHLGGHVQSGGYGQLGRSFGLFSDHVVSVEIVDYQGNIREVTRANDADMFFGILGGSPGNFAVLTHFTIKVHRDQDYKGSRGLKSLFFYNPRTLERLLDILVEMSDNDDFPGNYDYCVSVLSSSNKLLDWFTEGGLDEKMREQHPEIYGDDGAPFWPRVIVVYAQWVPFSPSDVPDMGWFDRIREGSIFDVPPEIKPMSQLTKQWIFTNIREFDNPYVKSTHLTDSRTLGKDGWAAWMTKRIDAVVAPEANRVWLSAQLQCFGGEHSKFTTNADNGTSFNWRDSSLCVTADAFYGPGHKQTALDWHTINEQEGIGPNGKFCKTDRRVHWGSFGDYDLNKVWDVYYDNQEKYERLVKIRAKADPDGLFTPNTFSVARQ